MLGPARHSLTIGFCACLLVTMLALLVASCGKPGTGIAGIVIERRAEAAYIGGMPTPSPLPDGFGMSTDMPVKGPLPLLVEPISGSKSGQVVAKVQTNDDGLFKVTVPPGRYVVVIKGANRESDYPSQPLTVRAGRYSRLVFFMTTH